MIEVDKLCKSYGSARALDHLSFTVERGEVVGFLGPNGAGKSTTMKILTGYLLPTSGSARVDGLDVVADSLEVRRRIGYLPESTPLYGEMRVDDYLRFVAEIRGIRGAQTIRRAVSRVIDLCGLERVVGKTIIELSKGYRQRVGLGQAMVHDPDILVLDEPTSGLDPNQIVEVRTLIKQLSEQHTVILSTHYLQEVEASCSRVIIVHLGRKVADSSQADLLAQQPPGPVMARIRGPREGVLAQLGELLADATCTEVERDGELGLFRIEVAESAGVEEGIARLVVKNGWSLAEIVRQRPHLEDVFRALTLDRPTAAARHAEVAHA